MASPREDDYKIPGASRLRQAEDCIRTNGFLVLPDVWNAEWTRVYLVERLKVHLELVEQFRLETTYKNAVPPEVRQFVPGAKVRVLIEKPINGD